MWWKLWPFSRVRETLTAAVKIQFCHFNFNIFKTCSISLLFQTDLQGAALVVLMLCCWTTLFIVKSEQVDWIRILLFQTQKSCWTRIWFQTGGIHLCVQGQRYTSGDTQVLLFPLPSTMNCLKSFSEHFQTFKRNLFSQNTNRNSCRKDQQGVRTISLYS